MITKLMPWFLLGCLIGLLAYFMERYGYEKGYAKAQDNCKTANIKTLTDTIATGKQLIIDANAASLTLNQTIADRIATDRQTISEIRRALTTTTHLRVNCVLPDDVMRELTTARQRANKAATSGVANAVPTAAGAD